MKLIRILLLLGWCTLVTILSCLLLARALNNGSDVSDTYDPWIVCDAYPYEEGGPVPLWFETVVNGADPVTVAYSAEGDVAYVLDMYGRAEPGDPLEIECRACNDDVCSDWAAASLIMPSDGDDGGDDDGDDDGGSDDGGSDDGGDQPIQMLPKKKFDFGSGGNRGCFIDALQNGT